MRRGLTLLCIVSIWLGVGPVAEGNLLWHPDARNDARSDDLTGVRLSTHRREGIKLLRVNADLWVHDDELDRCCDRVTFVFDSRGDEAPDYLLTQATDGASGGLYEAALTRVGEGPVKARFRRSRDCREGYYCPAFPVRFKIGLLHPTKHIRWYVETGEDRAPDVGWFEH